MKILLSVLFLFISLQNSGGSGLDPDWYMIYFKISDKSFMLFPPPPPPADVPSYQKWASSVGGVITSSSAITQSSGTLVVSRKSFANNVDKEIDCVNVTDVLIEYCYFTDANVRAVEIENGTKVTIRRCFFQSNRTAIYLLNCDATNSIKIEECVFLNVTGPPANALPIQFDKCAAPGALVQYNYIVNLPSESDSQDKINMFSSNGASGNPILIKKNYIWGWGPSTSGGGIIVDGSSSGSESSYVDIDGNILIYPGQYGCSVTAGDHNRIKNNVIYQTQETWTNVGIAIYDIANQMDCADNEATGNRVWYINNAGNQTGSYFPTDCTGTINSGNTFSDNTLTDAFPPQTETLWWKRGQQRPLE